MSSDLTLADITARVDDLIAKCQPAILAIVNTLTADDPHVAALFDTTDDEAMEIYDELGLREHPPERAEGRFCVLDLRREALYGALERHDYVPIDEATDLVPGTVLLFLFTRTVVVARRFEKGAEPVRELREVVRTRDVEIRTSLRVSGAAAIEVILQNCAKMLQKLYDGGTDRVALIQKASHGAKVGFLDRATAVSALRRPASAAAKDRKLHEEIAAEIERGPKPGLVPCLLYGWESTLHVNLRASSLAKGSGRDFDARSEKMLGQWIAACGDQKRALGLLEKSADGLGPSGSVELLDLIALVRHRWTDCQAILEQSHAVRRSLPKELTPPVARTYLTLTALEEATLNRKPQAS